MTSKNSSLLLVIMLATLFLCCRIAVAQDTFSIVAIDSLTGEIGSAGASCVSSSSSYPHGAQILSDVIPGIGAIHTQAAWDPANQSNAHDWMMMGLPPQQIIDSLVAHDAGGNPTTRQYGIVDYNGGHPRSAAYTGMNCSNYKNDTANLNYSIQGNILMGQQILDSMQTRFLNTTGTLADRLMAALQGAKVIGADTRCAVHGTSSESSFLRVAKITDPADSLYLDLWMAYPAGTTGIFPKDPIDSLQILYNLWKASTLVREMERIPAYPIRAFTDASGMCIFDFTLCKNWSSLSLKVIDIYGRCIKSAKVTSRIMKVNPGNTRSREILLYNVTDRDQHVVEKGKLIR
ncbi:MAG: DUF1028 domain-containing protein [Bacteroidetes bacterium]|nr:DUF1028 domain-containing protein [Bacteroidota bacterium]